MIGIIVAIVLAFCKVDVSLIALLFIGFQLFDISLNLSYFRLRDKRMKKAMETFFEGMKKGFDNGREESDK